MEELDIESDRQIDPDALDVEWLEQSNRFFKYSDALNEATTRRNEIKTVLDEKAEYLKTLKAELELKARSNPKEFDIEKATDSAVKAAVLASVEYQEALEEFFEVQREMNTAQEEVNRRYRDVNTMQEKKEAMKNLVILLNQQYFSTPVVPRDLTAEYQRYQKVKTTQKQARERVKDTKKKRRK